MYDAIVSSLHLQHGGSPEGDEQLQRVQAEAASDCPRPPDGWLLAQGAIATAGDVGQDAVEYPCHRWVGGWMGR